jgi:CheY-like chemotaxis protein
MVAAKRMNHPGVSTKPTVLVVEHVPVVRMLLANHLRGSGFQVVEAANGEEAIRIVEAGRPVQLVLSDVHMPGASMDGYSYPDCLSSSALVSASFGVLKLSA